MRSAARARIVIRSRIFFIDVATIIFFVGHEPALVSLVSLRAIQYPECTAHTTWGFAATSQPLTLLFIQPVARFLRGGFGKFPCLVGRYCSYLLPKQAGGIPQILLFTTLLMTGRPTVYSHRTYRKLNQGLRE